MNGSHVCKLISEDMIVPYLELIKNTLEMMPNGLLNQVRNKLEECPIYATETMIRLVDSAPGREFTF